MEDSKQVLIAPLEFDAMINRIGHAIRYFRAKNYTVDQLRIFMPAYLIEMMITHASQYIFIARIEPFKIQNVQIEKGYDNKIIVANSHACHLPAKIEFKEIEMPFQL